MPNDRTGNSRFVAAIQRLPQVVPHRVGDLLYHGSRTGVPVEQPRDCEFFVSADLFAAGFFAVAHGGQRVVSVYRVIREPTLAQFTCHGSSDLGPDLAPLDMYGLCAAFASSYPGAVVDGWHALVSAAGSETLLHRPNRFLEFDGWVDAPPGRRIDR